jgi:hypothetical protein
MRGGFVERLPASGLVHRQGPCQEPKTGGRDVCVDAAATGRAEVPHQLPQPLQPADPARGGPDAKPSGPKELIAA